MQEREELLHRLSCAKNALVEDVTLAIAGEEVTLRRERGIAPLLDLLAEGRDLHGYAAADRVVGKAAALLYVLLGVGAVYADVMSAPAERVFSAHKIMFEAGTRTESIRSRDGKGFCPMETAVAETDDPVLARSILEEKRRKLQRGE